MADTDLIEHKNRAQGMVRSMDQWRNMVPRVVAEGSHAQVEYALIDAKHDIEMLWIALASLSQPAKGEREGGAFAEMLTALRQVEAEMRAGLGSSYGETREQVRRAIASAERCGNE